MKKNTFHLVVYRILWFIIKPFMSRIYNFKYDIAKPKNTPFIVLSNHVTNLDPILVGLSFPQQMYFVASEHLFRIRFVSSILKFLVAPILRVKARTEMHTAIAILRTLKNGNNVCMFAEGSCSWNGETGVITEATAKLVKKSGKALITYRLTGGYFTQPRWGKFKRRGQMEGRIIKEYSPEEISLMSDETLYNCIKNDLYVNAFEDNAKAKIQFKGKNPAEYLETSLFICPKCHKIGSLKSDGDRFFCSCGLSLRYTTLGLFESLTEKEAPFKCILEWDKWQRNFIIQKTDFHKNLPQNTPILSDKNQMLYSFETGTKTQQVGEGDLILYNDRLVLQDTNTGQKISFLLKDITDMAVIQRTLLTFSVKGKQFYEIKSKHPRASIKYPLICRSLTDLRVML
ncbi:MAG: 1-acyl-sn-glycerol-3-phosphate acyltransferase [Firmicutes bacterium]|nr:1-acyl-sn-glycerol-3-phosphate acyltransferase [Bacillota bacterium]